MVSAFNISNTYMLMVDGWGYSLGGVTGGYAADAIEHRGVCAAGGVPDRPVAPWRDALLAPREDA